MQEGAEDRETFVESEEEEEDLDDSDTELSEQQSKDPIIQAYAQARKQRAEKISSACNISLLSGCAYFLNYIPITICKNMLLYGLYKEE